MDYENAEDIDLVRASQEGDTRAFDGLIRRHSPRVYGLIYNMTSNHEDTGDMLQEVFSKAFRSIKGFRGNSAFYTWLHTIAVNMTINFLKKRGRYPKLSLSELQEEAFKDAELRAITAASNPAKEANLSELQQKLNEALQKLSIEHRTVVTMFDVQGIPHKEISQILGISEGTVRSRLHYAHKQLQIFLRDFRPQTANQTA